MKALGSLRFVLFLIILGVLILNTAWAGSQLALAAQGQWGTAALIEQEGYDAVEPSVAVDGSGNAVAVWYQRDGIRDNIWANRYVAGTGWGTATLIEVEDGTTEGPQVAVNPSGNAVAVWGQYDGTRHNIWANRYVAGTGWGSATLIEVGAGEAYYQQVAVDAGGNAIAVWSQYDGIQDNIWANRYVAGTGWGSATLIEVGAGGCGSPQVAVDGSGNAIAVWSQYDGIQDNIWANRYVAGTGWGSATLIEVGANNAFDPQVAVDAGGNAVAVWSQHDGTGYICSTWANRYVAGTGWGSATLIEVGAGGCGSPQVAVDGSGNAVAVWSQYDGTDYSIWTNRYVAGTGWVGATLIEVGAGGCGSPQVAVDGSGNAVAVWSQYDGTDYSIWTNRYVAGTGWVGATLIEVGAGDANEAQVAVALNGNAVAVWTQDDGTRSNIWANCYSEAPVVSSLEPAQATTGQTLQVVIHGAHLTGATTVSFGPGITVSITADNATQITASISISGSATPGARDVSVTTPGGTATKTGGLTVWTPPTISAVSPNSGVQGQSLSVAITGTYLTGATAVNFGPGITVSNFSADNATQITASISISGSATPGARDVSVTTTGGTATATAAFTVKTADSTPPVVIVDKSPTKTASCIITVTGTASDNASGVGVVMYSIDGRDAWYEVTSLVAGPVDTKECTYTIRVFLPPGTHKVEIRATDSAGNTTAKKDYAEVAVTTGSRGVKAWVVVIAVLGTLALLGAIGYLVWRYRGKIRERSTQKVNEAKQKLSE